METVPHEESVHPDPTEYRDWRRWVRRRLTALLATAAVLLVFGFAWPFDAEGPVAIGWAAFMVRTFVFHAGVAMLVIAAASLLVKSRVIAIAAVPLVAFSLWPEWAPPSRARVSGPTIRVMSMNLLAGNRQYGRAVAQILDADPDLVLLQEYGPNWDTAMTEGLSDSHPHVLRRPRTDSFGVAVYSKLPLSGVEWFEVGGVGTPQVRTTIDFDGRTIAVYAIHLLPPAGLDNTQDTWRQHASLVKRLEAETLPILLAGDFNFTPRSAQAARFRRMGLTEAHAQGGRWRGTTWPAIGMVSLAPGIRLDQVYLDEDLACEGSRVLGANGSDHRPILVDVGIRSAD